MSNLESSSHHEKIAKIEEKQATEILNTEINKAFKGEVDSNFLKNLQNIFQKNGINEKYKLQQLSQRITNSSFENKKQVTQELQALLLQNNLKTLDINVSMSTEDILEKTLNSEITQFASKSNINLSEVSHINNFSIKEKTAFLKNIKETNDSVKRGMNLNFYDNEGLTKITKQLFQCKNILDQNKIVKRLRDVERKESQYFTYLNDTVKIAGQNVKAFSDISLKKTLDYYKSASLDDREKMDLKAMVENEKALLLKLATEYGNNTELLKIAIVSFSKLDYMAKEAAIKDYIKFKNTNDGIKKLTKRAINIHIKNAVSEKTISPKDATKFKEYFSNENNFIVKTKNEKDNLIQYKHSAKKLQQAYKILTVNSEHLNLPNLYKFKIQNIKFYEKIDQIKQLNANNELNKEDTQLIKKYENSTYIEKNKILKNVDKLLKKRREERFQEQNNEEKENMSLEELEKSTIKEALLLQADDKPQEALDALSDFNRANPGHEKILFYMHEATFYMLKFSKRKTEDQKKQDIIDKKLSSEEIQKRIRELKALEENARITQINQEKENRTIDALERKRKKLVKEAKTQSTKDATNEYFSTNRENLKKDMTNRINISNSLEESFIKKTERYTQKDREGERDLGIQFTDKSGNNISAEFTKKLIEKEKKKLTENIYKENVYTTKKTKNEKSEVSRKDFLESQTKELFS